MGSWRGVGPVVIIYLMLVFGDLWTGNKMLGPGFLVGVPVLVLVVGVVSWLGDSDR